MLSYSFYKYKICISNERRNFSAGHLLQLETYAKTLFLGPSQTQATEES